MRKQLHFEDTSYIKMYCRKHLISKLPVTQAVIPIGELS